MRLASPLVFLLRVPFERHDMAAFNALRGSHREAVYSGRGAVRVLLTAGSWVGFLISTVAEYGFDVDFLLSPVVWLVVATCMMATVSTFRFAALNRTGNGPSSRAAIHAGLMTNYGLSAPGSRKLATMETVSAGLRLFAPTRTPRGEYAVVTNYVFKADGIMQSAATTRGPPVSVGHRLCVSTAVPRAPPDPFTPLSLPRPLAVPFASCLTVTQPEGRKS
jgi:hypothetical protein